MKSLSVAQSARWWIPSKMNKCALSLNIYIVKNYLLRNRSKDPRTEKNGTTKQTGNISRPLPRQQKPGNREQLYCKLNGNYQQDATMILVQTGSPLVSFKQSVSHLETGYTLNVQQQNEEMQNSTHFSLFLTQVSQLLTIHTTVKLDAIGRYLRRRDQFYKIKRTDSSGCNYHSSPQQPMLQPAMGLPKCHISIIEKS